MTDMTARPKIAPARWPLLLGALLGACAVDGGILLRFPYLRGNVPLLVLALVTPPLIGLVGGLRVSRVGSHMPRAATLALRGALVLLVLADVVVFVGPLFIGGATGHDSAPQFVVVPTATAIPAATAAPTALPSVGPFTFTFHPTPGEGGTTGQAILGTVAGGAVQLRLQGFHTNNGPNLHVFLSHAAQPTSDAKVRDGYDLGPLTATEGDKNYAVPAGIDSTTIQSVVIYCESFNALFGYASH